MQKHDRDMEERRTMPGLGYAENYTTAFLVSFGVLTFVGLFAVWAVFGLPFTVVLALLIERFLLR